MAESDGKWREVAKLTLVTKLIEKNANDEKWREVTESGGKWRKVTESVEKWRKVAEKKLLQFPKGCLCKVCLGAKRNPICT